MYILSLGTFCPGTFCHGDVLSGDILSGDVLSGDVLSGQNVPACIYSQAYIAKLSGQNVPAWLYRQAGTFCPDKTSPDKMSPHAFIDKRGRFVMGTFCPWGHFVRGRFVMGTFCLGDVLT